MIKPFKYPLEIYKGADFIFDFRLKDESGYIDLTGCTIYFRASNKADGTNEFSFSSTDSPQTITIDTADNNLIRVLIDKDDTAALTVPELYYEIDLLDAEGLTHRYLIGSISVYGDAA